jgi:ADP-heptose:LPS heptosyltransferase
LQEYFGNQAHFNYIISKISDLPRITGFTNLMSEIRRILVVRTDRIGDVVLTLPMVDVLRMNYPDAYIAMIVREYTADLARNSDNIDEVILYDRNGKLIPFFEILDIIRRRKFDIVFLAFPRMRLAILMWLAGIPNRVGTGYRLYSIFFNKRVFEHRKHAVKHELEYNLNLLKAFGCTTVKIEAPWINVPRDTTEKVKQKLSGYGIDTSSDSLVIIHPGSGGSSCNWRIENFSRLGKLISGISNTKIIITGGKGEEQLVRKLQNEIADNVVSIANEFSLVEFVALAKLADLFIGNSTGPLHIAAAVGIPVIGFYPHIVPMSAKRWGPYTDKSVVFTPVNKPYDCMGTISVEDVFESVKEILKRKIKC